MGLATPPGPCHRTLRSGNSSEEPGLGDAPTPVCRTRARSQVHTMQGGPAGPGRVPTARVSFAEEAVNEVKRQAMSELQKAVSDAERKAHELISTERAKMERALAEARRQASEDALTVVNQQEDSSEVWPLPRPQPPGPGPDPSLCRLPASRPWAAGAPRRADADTEGSRARWLALGRARGLVGQDSNPGRPTPVLWLTGDSRGARRVGTAGAHGAPPRPPPVHVPSRGVSATVLLAPGHQGLGGVQQSKGWGASRPRPERALVSEESGEGRQLAQGAPGTALWRGHISRALVCACAWTAPGVSSCVCSGCFRRR